MADGADGAADLIAAVSLDSSSSSTAAGAETVSKNALKRELKKKKKKEEENRQKEEEMKLKAASIPQTQKKASGDDDDMDPMVSISIEQYIDKYGNLVDGQRLEEDKVHLAGRIMNKRSSSAKLFFYDLHGGGFKVQVMADAKNSDMDEAEFSRYHSSVKCGDIVGIIGFPGKSNRGELKYISKNFYCFITLPSYDAKAGSCPHFFSEK